MLSEPLNSVSCCPYQKVAMDMMVVMIKMINFLKVKRELCYIIVYFILFIYLFLHSFSTPLFEWIGFM